MLQKQSSHPVILYIVSNVASLLAFAELAAFGRTFLSVSCSGCIMEYRLCGLCIDVFFVSTQGVAD